MFLSPLLARPKKVTKCKALREINGSKSFLLKKIRDRYRFANDDKGASRVAILD